jgi:hypothetical protein
MKKILLLVLGISLLAVGCDKVELKKEQPSSPQEGYQTLPK